MRVSARVFLPDLKHGNRIISVYLIDKKTSDASEDIRWSEDSEFRGIQFCVHAMANGWPPSILSSIRMKRNRDPTRTPNHTHSLIYIGNNPPNTDSEKSLGSLWTGVQ